MTCAEILELVHDDADGRLDPSKRAAVAAHVASCASCATAARQLRDLRAALRAIPRVTAPPALREDVMDRLGRGRILSLPRMLFPIAAAATLLVGAVVLSRVVDRNDRNVALLDADGALAPALEGSSRATSRDGFTTEEALEGARGSRDATGTPAGKKRAEAMQDGQEGAQDGKDARRREAGDASDAPAEPTPTAASPDPPPPAKSAPPAAERMLDRESPDMNVIVFRTETEARAFMAAVAPVADANRAPGGGSAPTPGADAGAPRTRAETPDLPRDGDDPDGGRGLAGAGRRGPGVGGGGGTAAPVRPRILGRVDVADSNAWRALAVARQGRVVTAAVEGGSGPIANGVPGVPPAGVPSTGGGAAGSELGAALDTAIDARVLELVRADVLARRRSLAAPRARDDSKNKADAPQGEPLGGSPARGGPSDPTEPSGDDPPKPGRPADALGKSAPPPEQAGGAAGPRPSPPAPASPVVTPPRPREATDRDAPTLLVIVVLDDAPPAGGSK